MAMPQVHPARTIKGRVVRVCVETAPHPETRDTDCLQLDFEGMPGTRHYGFLRKAGSREPWHPKGSLIRSSRQISLVSVEELAVIAADMGLPGIEAGWIGGNILIEGVPQLSWLPIGSRIFASSGAVLLIEAQNAPCRIAGKAIANHLAPDQREGIDLAFARKAVGRRGLVATVERSGSIRRHDDIKIQIGKQWLYGLDERQLPLI